MVEHALRYAAEGFAVFPVYEPLITVGNNGASVINCSCGKDGCRGKHPRTIRGVVDASVNYEQLKEWWTKWPNASIGGATGKVSGFSVVDLDGQEGLMSGKALRLSSTVSALTGNGKQLFFADTEGKLGNSVRKLSAGVDTRGTGGYVILPPSLHPSGKRYQWEGQPLSRRALSSMPDRLADMGIPTITYTQRKPDGWIAEALKGMKNGNIDTTLTSICGRLRRDGYSPNDAILFLQHSAEMAGATPGHVEDKVRHIWKAYPSVVPQVHRSETIDEFLQEPQKVEWICEPIIAKRSIGFIAGLPATCKTWMMIDLAVESARDCGNWLGIFPVMQSKVLLIDQERFKGETQRRFSAVIAGKGLKSSDLKGNLFLKCGTTIRLDLETSFQAFKAELLDLRPNLVIVDSFATFHSSNETDRMSIQLVLNRIKELRDEIGCAFWFINHESKMVFQQIEDNKAPNAFTMMGSVGIVAAAESVLIVRKIESGQSMVHHCKSTMATASKSFTVGLTDTGKDAIIIKGQI